VVQRQVSHPRVQGPGLFRQGQGSRVNGSVGRFQGPRPCRQGPGSRVQGPGLCKQGSGSRIQGYVGKVQATGSGFRVHGAGCRVQGSGSRAHGVDPGPKTEGSAWHPSGLERVPTPSQTASGSAPGVAPLKPLDTELLDPGSINDFPPWQTLPGRCRTNIAHIRLSRPDYVLGLERVPPPSQTGSAPGVAPQDPGSRAVYTRFRVQGAGSRVRGLGSRAL